MTLAKEPSQGGTPAKDWEQIKKDADAETAALEAQKKLHDAQEALKATEAPLDPAKKVMDEKLAEIKAAKELAEAEKAAADARKAEADAALAAFKAKIGEVPSSGYTGDVTLKDKAGITEAALLAAKAVKTAAAKIVEALPKQTVNRSVLLYTMDEAPNFQALIVYRTQTALMEKAFTDAESASNEAYSKVPEPVDLRIEEVPYAAAAGLTLDAVNKLLGFFRTDYTVGGVDIKLDDSLLIHALAGIIAGSDRKFDVQLPAIYSPAALSNAASGILNEITKLSLMKLGAQEKAGQHDKLSARFTDNAGKETDTATKTALLDKSRTHKAAADASKAAVGLYDGFFSKLTTADEKGSIPFINVIREQVVADALMNGNSLLLLVKLQQSGGAYYTKKNMLTFFGSTPFYHMGGAIASFVLLDGKTGQVLTSGVVPVHGGFVKANKLPDEIK